MKVVLAILAILLVIGWWQNEKENAARANRPTIVERFLSDSPSSDKAESESRRSSVVERIISGSTASENALRNPESMTPEQRQLAAEWGNGSKRFYVEQVDALEKRLSARMEGGYVWGRESEHRARASIRALNDAIDRDDFLAVPTKFSEAKESLRLFEAGCRWRAGLRHPSIQHIYSAEREGYWNADQGWLFPRQGSLEVARKCRRCNGGGQETVMVTCDRCNGACAWNRRLFQSAQGQAVPRRISTSFKPEHDDLRPMQRTTPSRSASTVQCLWRTGMDTVSCHVNNHNRHRTQSPNSPKMAHGGRNGIHPVFRLHRRCRLPLLALRGRRPSRHSEKHPDDGPRRLRRTMSVSRVSVPAFQAG